MLKILHVLIWKKNPVWNQNILIIGFMVSSVDSLIDTHWIYKWFWNWRQFNFKTHDFNPGCILFMEYLKLCVFQVCYVYLVLNKAVVLPWIAQIKEVLWKCCTFLKSLKVCYYISSKCMLHYCKNVSSNTGFVDICSCNIM